MCSFSFRIDDFVRDIVRLTDNFSPTTWAVIAVASVIFGYAMLKGMSINGR